MHYAGLIQAHTLKTGGGLEGRHPLEEKELECSNRMNPTPTVMGSDLVLGFSERDASQSDKP